MCAPPKKPGAEATGPAPTSPERKRRDLPQKARSGSDGTPGCTGYRPPRNAGVAPDASADSRGIDTALRHHAESPGFRPGLHVPQQARSGSDGTCPNKPGAEATGPAPTSPERKRRDLPQQARSGSDGTPGRRLQITVHMYITSRMRHEVGSVVRPDPLAFFLTWTAYGSWLPGDARGWVDDRGAIREPNERLARSARRLLQNPVVVLDGSCRRLVEQVIREHCGFRNWTVHAVNCRTTHVHVVVSAEQSPEAVLRSLKGRCSRKLSEAKGVTERWWTKGGSVRRLFDTRALETVVVYVVECQDR
jgi:REP element-mobilizing transposase RayT